MLEKWVTSQWGEIPMVLLSALVTYAAILLFTRIVGLRSFSKMSSADFAMTVAVGSMFATTISSGSPSLIVGLVAIACLYFGQWTISNLRRKFAWFTKAIDNAPVLLMAGETMLDENLARCKVTREDVFGKLREANAFSFNQVLAVVFESTGDISVIHTTDSDAELAPEFFGNVIGGEQLFEES